MIRKKHIIRGLFPAMLGLLLLTACSRQEASPVPEPAQENWSVGTLQLKLGGLISSDVGSRALMSAHKAKVTLVNPQSGIPESRDYDITGAGEVSMVWDNLPAGSGWTIQVDLFNRAISEVMPQVSGKGTADIIAGGTAEVSILCLPLSPKPLTSVDFPWKVSLPAGGEDWSVLKLAREGRYSFSPDQDTCTVRFFNKEGLLLGESVQGAPWVLETEGPQEIIIGLHLALTSLVTLNMAADYPPAHEGLPAAPAVLEPSREFRTFLLGQVGGGEDTSWYAIKASETGTWWLDMPYSSDYRWELTGAGDPSVVLGSGANTTGLKFDLTAGMDYLLTLKNTKAPQDLKILGRLLSPTLVEISRFSEGSPSLPVTYPLEIPGTWKMGGRNFDCTSWLRITAGSGGWQEFNFGEAGTGSYSVELYRGDPSAGPLLTWSNTENVVQRVKLNTAEVYTLKAFGQFSSGIKETLWPVRILTTELPLATLVTTEVWHSGTLSAGAADWYQFPVQGGQWYLVSWDDKSQGTGGFSGDIRVSAYTAGRKEPLFLYKDKGYSTRWVVQVPPGEGELFCLVQGLNPGSLGTYGLKVAVDGGGLNVQVK